MKKTIFMISFLLPLILYSETKSSSPLKRGISICSDGSCGENINKKNDEQTNRAIILNGTNKQDGIKAFKFDQDEGQKKKDRVVTPRKQNKGILEAQNKKVKVINSELSNLPSSYFEKDRSLIPSSDKVILVVKSGLSFLKNLKSGDMLNCVIEQSIKASPSVTTPIRAIIVGGQYKGAFLLGHATLDRELKRVLLSFEKIRLKEGDLVYNLKATGLSLSGEVGLTGDYHNESGKFFIGEMVSATAAGFADATIQRTQNSQGNYVQEPSISNATKTGAVTALSRSADRMAEGFRSAPEYTQIKGYQEIKVIIEEDPKVLADGS